MLVATYISLTALAFLFSLVVLGKKYPRYLSIFVIILGADVVIEVWGNYLPKPFYLTRNGLYNVVMLIEFWGYGFYYAHVLRNKIINKTLKFYLVIFPLMWIVLVCLLADFNTWNSYLSVIGSVAMIILSACMYYQLFTTTPLVKLTTSFEFWIATGLIIFFACNFTYLGMLNLLSDLYRRLSHELLILLQISNCVFYCMVAYAFICLYRNNIKENKPEPLVANRTTTNDPNRYGMDFDPEEVKGSLSIDASSDNNGPKSGYLQIVRTFFSTMSTHTNVATAAKNLLAASRKTKFIAIAGHGQSGILGVGIGNRFDPGSCTDKCISKANEQTWKPLFDGLKTNPIENLYLLSCYTGSEEKGAQLLYDLANSINATVAAPTGQIIVFPENGSFKLQDKSEWQVAKPLPALKPRAIEKPVVEFPPFADKINVFEPLKSLEVSLPQIKAILIIKPENWDKLIPLQPSDFKPMLSLVNFTVWENLQGGIIAGFITGAFIVQFDFTPDNSATEQRERKYFVFNNLYIQDAVYPDIVYHCKESIGDFFLPSKPIN